jgi:hypothetical protein
MVIGQSQFFMIALVLSSAIGARRGWSREVITCAIVLGTVLFLLNGGADMLNTFLGNLTHSVGGTASAHALSGGTAPGVSPSGVAPTYAAATTGAACSPVTSQTLGTLIFAGMSFLGYRTGSKYGSAPTLHTHRIAGTIPGAVNGASMAYYLSHGVLTGKQLLLYTPSGNLTSTYLPQIFGIGLAGLLVVLFIASQTGKSKGSK